MRLSPKRVRTRLTLWYVVMLTAMLVVNIAGAGLLLFWQMRGQLQHHAVQDLETVEGLLYFSDTGQLRFHEDYHNHPESKLVQERLLEVLAPGGAILYRNDRLGDLTIGGAPFPGEGQGGYSERYDLVSDGTRVIAVSRRHILDGQPILIRVAYTEDSIWSRSKVTLSILLLLLPFDLAIAAYAGNKMARRALDPVEKMAQRAEQITSERLNERLVVENGEDELGHLAAVFNGALSRIEQSFENLKRFTSDASHELRTPLAAIRSIGEVALQQDTSPEDYKDIIGSMLEEVNRLTHLADSLLTLSRADAGQIPIHFAVFPVIELLREAANLLEVLIEDKTLTFTLTGEEHAFVRGDRVFLRQAIINILHNAVKFTPAGGTISARISCEASQVILSVTDNGPGIPPEYWTKVFDRFYRVDRAATVADRGAGLGLSIARWAVQAQGGEIGIVGAPAGGCTFWIRLPAALLASGDPRPAVAG